MYASVYDVESGFRPLTSDEQKRCGSLLRDAAAIVDAYNKDASETAKRLVSCNMVRRVLGSGANSVNSVPMGATTGSMGALGYSQSWTLSSGAVGELYVSKTDKKLLGVSSRIGSRSPLEGFSHDCW